MYQMLTTTTITILTEIEKLRYRFNGTRYSFQGGASDGPVWTIEQFDGFHAFPKTDSLNDLKK